MSNTLDNLDTKAEVFHDESYHGKADVDSSDHHQHNRSRAEDDAANILREVGNIEFSVEEDRRILRKIDLWVLTPMLLIYTLQQMDKSSVSYAAVFGLQADTNLHGTQYSWLTSVVYIAQLVWQPISSYALVRLPLARWICFNVISWGIVVACTCLAKNFTALVICRTLLGVFEATVAPTFVAITQLWWRRREQSFRTTAWLISNSCAAIFGPLISYGVGHIDSSLKEYQVIFLFMGCLTIGAVPILWYMLPDDIGSARFLKTPRDKAIAVERLRANNTGTKTSVWKWYQCKEALLEPKSWGWFMLLMLTAIPSGGIGSFGGLITKGFGFDSFKSILFQMPIGVMQIIVLISGTWIINKIHKRWLPIAVITLFPIGGAIGMRYIPRANHNSLLGAYYITCLYGCIQPLLYSWANMNAAGTTKQRTVGGLMFVGQCLGNIIGPQVYLAREAPLYYTGLYVDIACWSLDFLGILAMGWYLNHLNKRQERRREAEGRVAKVADMSILTLEQAAEYKKKLAAEAAEKGEVVNEHSYEDMTDQENPEFQYVV